MVLYQLLGSSWSVIASRQVIIKLIVVVSTLYTTMQELDALISAVPILWQSPVIL